MNKQANRILDATLYENAWLHSNPSERCKIDNLMAKSCHKGRKKKSQVTMAQEIEVIKQICQLYKTWDVCELASRGVL